MKDRNVEESTLSWTLLKALRASISFRGPAPGSSSKEIRFLPTTSSKHNFALPYCPPHASWKPAWLLAAVAINLIHFYFSCTSTTMTETPEPSRRPLWMYETPSPRSSHSDLTDFGIGMFSHHTKSSDLVGVLQQVSELTMEDDAFSKSSNLRTPTSLMNNPRLNPRSCAREIPAFFGEDSKRKPSPFDDFRKKVRRSNSSIPNKVMTAPPLPSSPDLSAGGDPRPIPPQFSPLGSSHMIDIGPLLQRSMDTEMSFSPEGHPPMAPPPTPQVAGLPPPMPWIETPEQGPGRKVVLNHLQMRKGPFSFS